MRLIALAFALALLATDASAQASRPQSSAKIPSVGVLYPGVPDPAIGAPGDILLSLRCKKG